MIALVYILLVGGQPRVAVHDAKLCADLAKAVHETQGFAAVCQSVPLIPKPPARAR